MSLMDETKSDSLLVRCTNRDLALIDKASAVLKQNRSEFVRESVLDHAKNVLMDRRSYELSLSNFLELEAILAKPAKPNLKLKEILNTKALWE